MSKEFIWNDILVEQYAATKDFQSMEDFKKQFAEPELQWFVITSNCLSRSIKSWVPIKQHKGDMGGYPYSVYFDNEDDAKTFVVRSKPCISINDLYVWFGQTYDIKRLEELVKSKL
jgi:hypothetical protein